MAKEPDSKRARTDRYELNAAIERSDDAIISSFKEAGYSILSCSHIAHDLKFLKLFYETNPVEFLSLLNVKNKDQSTLLLTSAKEQHGYKIDPEVIKFLIELGADITADIDGSTILHETAVINNLELLTWLYEKKPTEFISLVNKKNDHGYGLTPLLKFCRLDLDSTRISINFESAKFLISKGAALNPPSPYYITSPTTILHCYIIYTNLEFLNWLFTTQSTECNNILDKRGYFDQNFPLAVATIVSAEAVEFSLNYQGLDFRFDNGDTIFHQDYALLIGEKAIHNLWTKYPQKFAETIEVENNKKETPLIKVAKLLNKTNVFIGVFKFIAEKIEVIKLFLKFGAVIPFLEDIDATLDNYCFNLIKKLFKAAQFADNILSKSSTLGLISPEEEIAYNLAANFELIADRVKNKWERGDQDPELPHYILNALIPQELKAMLLETTEREAFNEVLEDIEEGEVPLEGNDLVIYPPAVFKLSEMVTKSAWARREAAVKAFGAKWHDIIAIREANARAEAEGEEVHKEDAVNNYADDIDTTTVSTTCIGADSLTAPIY